ncbi:MAG: spore coat U domain-containing protein [Caulobacterales bacterium]
MQVTASVAASCSVDAHDLAFGAYNPFSGTDLPGATTIDVTCTNGTTYVVSIDAGGGSGATVATRKMTAVSTLNYSLYRDASHTLVWGITSGANTVAGTGSGALQTLNVYGLVPAGQAVPAGSYVDNVLVTVTY